LILKGVALCQIIDGKKVYSPISQDFIARVLGGEMTQEEFDKRLDSMDIVPVDPIVLESGTIAICLSEPIPGSKSAKEKAIVSPRTIGDSCSIAICGTKL
jgi:hypothetical protein